MAPIHYFDLISILWILCCRKIDTQSKINTDEYVIKIENSIGQKDLFFNCKSCGKYLRSSESFEEHMEMHRKDIQIPCQDVVTGCGETFFTGSDMIKVYSFFHYNV